jgi:predicted XRE-type DNA-binding protein
VKYISDVMTQRQLAQVYGVDQSIISRLIRKIRSSLIH